NAREHLLEVKGLRHIIVGTGIEALDLIAPAIACGEDQHGHGAAGATPRFEYRDAVHFRQSDIQDDGIVRLTFAQIVPLLPIERPVDRIAGVRKSGSELSIEIRIILDDEETQSKVPPLGRRRSVRSLAAQSCNYISAEGSQRKSGSGPVRR